MDKGSLIVVARQALVSMRPKALGVSNYGCVLEDGSYKDSPFNQTCHAGCSGFVAKNNGVVLYTITTGLGNPYQTKVPDDIAEKYFTWLCSEESPWAECLCNGYNADAKFVAQYGLIICDLDKHGKNLVVAALAASRACYEHPQHVLMWDRLTKDGLNLRWAFFLAGNATFNEADVIYLGMRTNTNHWPIHPWSASEEYIKNFLGQKVEFDKIPFNATGSQGPVGGVWGGKGVLYPSLPSDYWEDFKKKSNSSTNTPDGSFQSVVSMNYKNFLETAKQEQLRLYG